MESATTFFNNGRCCLPDQENVWHHATKFTEEDLTHSSDTF